MHESQITPALPGTPAAYLQAAALLKTLTPRTAVILSTDWPALQGAAELLYAVDSPDADEWVAELHRPGDTIALLVPDPAGDPYDESGGNGSVRVVSAQWLADGMQRITILPEFG